MYLYCPAVSALPKQHVEMSGVTVVIRNYRWHRRARRIPQAFKERR